MQHLSMASLDVYVFGRFLETHPQRTSPGPQARDLPVYQYQPGLPNPDHMVAAAWPGSGAACTSSPNSLLLSRPSPHAPPRASSMRRRRRRLRLVLGVGTPAVAALAAAAPPAVLRDGAATLFVTAGAYALVRTFDVLTERRLVEKVSAPSLILPSPVFLVSS